VHHKIGAVTKLTRVQLLRVQPEQMQVAVTVMSCESSQRSWEF